MLYDRKTGEKKNLTEKFDSWVGTFAWAPESSGIYFVAEDKGESPLYALMFEAATRGEKGYDISIRETNISVRDLRRGFNDDIAVAPTGKTPTVYANVLTSPDRDLSACLCQNGLSLLLGKDGPMSNPRSELHAIERHCHSPTSTTPSFPKSPCPPSNLSGSTARKGDKVQGFLVKPPNFDPNKKYPVKFLIHGGPQGAWGDDWSYRWNPELFAANGYVVIMINFHGSTGYGQKFIDAINGDWGGAPFEDLMKGLDYAEKTYPFIDKDRECALGASYGGYMANWILGHTDRFKCIVTHDGMFNSTRPGAPPKNSGSTNGSSRARPTRTAPCTTSGRRTMYATNFKTPTLVVHGQLDYRLDVSEGFQLFTTLQRQSVPSKMLYFPDEGHWVLKPQNSQLWYKTVNDWVDQWTKK